MARTVAIGVQDFGKVIENNYFYIDKTDFLKEWWENGDAVTLITRPRRFGKTLTMSMAEHFFSVKYAGRPELFEGLSIWKNNTIMQQQGKYPVIFFSFAAVKGKKYSVVREKICRLLIDLFSEHEFLLHSSVLTDEDKKFFKRITVGMEDADAAAAVYQLSKYLSKYYGRNVVILLDEYDTPMQEAYVNGYWDELADFTRSIFHAAFKTNPYLERGLMTGITRISKESVFSDLNNLEVVSATSCKYESVFGFTEYEVFQALEEYGMQDKKDEVRWWYDGFRFGDCDRIYNPWSITQYLDKKKFEPYWADTSSNAFIGKLIQEGSPGIKVIMEDLINGIPLTAAIDEQVVFNQLDQNENAVWGLLLAAGYLKVVAKNGREYVLDHVNAEVRQMFEGMISNWFSVCSSDYSGFIKAVLSNDIDSMNAYMNRIALETVSYFDTGNKASGASQPERFYHGLVLGLMMELKDQYKIASNRESGYGRYDVLFEPIDDVYDAMIFEFKVFDSRKEKSLAAAAQAAVRQIIEKKYAAGLESVCGRNRIRIYGFAFKGKEVWIEGGYLDKFA